MLDVELVPELDPDDEDERLVEADAVDVPVDVPVAVVVPVVVPVPVDVPVDVPDAVAVPVDVPVPVVVLDCDTLWLPDGLTPRDTDDVGDTDFVTVTDDVGDTDFVTVTDDDDDSDVEPLVDFDPDTERVDVPVLVEDWEVDPDGV